MLVRNPNPKKEAPSWAGRLQIPLLCIASDSSPVPKDPEPGPQAARGSQPEGSPPNSQGIFWLWEGTRGLGREEAEGIMPLEMAEEIYFVIK